MKKIIIVLLLLATGALLGRIAAHIPAPVLDPLANARAAQAMDGRVPSCEFCDADLIKADEIRDYIAVAMATGLTDQQIRSLDIGRGNVQVALAHRGPLSEPNPRSVAVHNLVTEVYVVLSGSATNVTGPDLIDAQPRPDDYRAVMYLNGPGQNAEAIRGGTEVRLEVGDVFVIPAGTGHQFTRIDDHITYLMVRIDPDKVVPLLDAPASRAYLDDNLR